MLRIYTGKMIVTIEFLGMQRQLTKTDSINMPITEKTRVDDAFEYVKQQYPTLDLDNGVVITTVNHETASLDRILKDNDTVSFIPIIGGG